MLPEHEQVPASGKGGGYLFSSLVLYPSEEGDSDLTRTMLIDRQSLVNLVDVEVKVTH